MMNEFIVKVEKSTRMVDLPKNVIGNDMENLQEKLIFKFTDEFVNGQGRLEYKIGSTKNYIVLSKENNTYILPLKNVLTKEGKIEMQLVITETSETEETTETTETTEESEAPKTENEEEKHEEMSVEKAILERFGNICESVDELVEMAQEGLDHRNEVISNALDSGVHSMGNSFNKDIFAKTFSNMNTKDIEQMGKAWEEEAKAKFEKPKVSKQDFSNVEPKEEYKRVELKQFKTGIY